MTITKKQYCFYCIHFESCYGTSQGSLTGKGKKALNAIACERFEQHPLWNKSEKEYV